MQKRTTAIVLSVLAVASFAPAAEPAKGAPAAATAGGGMSEEHKTLYAVGMAMARNLGNLNLTAAELEVVKTGMTDAVLNKPAQVKLEEYGPKIQGLVEKRQAVVAEAEKGESEKFLTARAADTGAQKLPSGLIYSETKPGTGASPAATDKVKVHYHGTLRTGEVFDSSVERKEPVTFALNQVIPCWTEGVQKMKVGGKSRLVCPAPIAYGDRGAPPKIKPGAALQFEVELIGIEK